MRVEAGVGARPGWWRQKQRAIAGSRTIAPGHENADSALLVSLAPGNYSAIVTGAGSATGLAIIEIYEVP